MKHKKNIVIIQIVFTWIYNLCYNNINPRKGNTFAKIERGLEEMKKIILASASSKRAKTLSRLNLDFDIIPTNIEKNVDISLSNEENVEKIALEKALEVANTVNGEDHIIIAADTIVINQKLLSKPTTEEEAFLILKALSGKTHQVVTGVCIFSTEENRGIISHRTTNVKFSKYNDELIRKYIKTGEIWDRNGAYNIQGLGSILVDSIDGCYSNIVGLPISLLCEMLTEFNINVL